MEARYDAALWREKCKNRLMRDTVTIDCGDFGAIQAGQSPLYARISECIEHYIQNKSPEPGTRMPTEIQLARHFDVSIITVRAALKQLADQGLLERQQGTGTFIGRTRNRTPTWSIGTLDGLTQYTQATDIEILHVGPARLPDWAAQDLHARPGEKRFHVRIVRHREGRGCQLTEAYYPQQIGEQLAAADMRGHLMRTHLVVGAVEEITGQRVAVIRQKISATSATKPVAETLQVPIRTPVLQISRLSETENGQVLQAGRSFYQTHDYAYAFDIYRK